MSDTPTTIADGVVVLFEYTLSGPDGAVIETVAGEGPIPYLHGAGNIVSGLEARMTGHAVGDSFKVVVPAAEAYGEHDGEDPEDTEGVPPTDRATRGRPATVAAAPVRAVVVGNPVPSPPRTRQRNAAPAAAGASSSSA